MSVQKLSNRGNVDDIRNTLRLIEEISVEDLEQNIAYEKAHKNRSSVINLFKSTINRIKKTL